jgi:hypothetical protein
MVLLAFSLLILFPLHTQGNDTDISCYIEAKIIEYNYESKYSGINSIAGGGGGYNHIYDFTLEITDVIDTIPSGQDISYCERLYPVGDIIEASYIKGQPYSGIYKLKEGRILRLKIGESSYSPIKELEAIRGPSDPSRVAIFVKENELETIVGGGIVGLVVLIFLLIRIRKKQGESK